MRRRVTGQGEGGWFGRSENRAANHPAVRQRDLEEIHRILNEAFGAGDPLEQVSSWLEWSALSARWLPAMNQPPYGDRAIVLRSTGELIGAVGYVPLLMPFDQIPELAREPGAGAPAG